MCPVGDKDRRIHMLRAFFGVATVLSLSATTAIAAPVPVRQQVNIASAHKDGASSNGPRDRSSPTAADAEYHQTPSNKPTTQSADSDSEPESIGEGSEP
jgi:hypothetical protein